MPEVWVYNNYPHHALVKTSSDRIVYDKVCIRTGNVNVKVKYCQCMVNWR